MQNKETETISEKLNNSKNVVINFYYGIPKSVNFVKNSFIALGYVGATIFNLIVYKNLEGNKKSEKTLTLTKNEKSNK